MLHRPCRGINPEASCHQNKYESCEHSLSKDHAPETRFEEDNRLHIYRRRGSTDGGEHHITLL